MTCAFGATPAAGVAPTDEIVLDRAAWEVLTGTPSTWFDWILGVFVTQFISAGDLCALNPADPPLPSVITIAKAFFKDPSSILDIYDYVRAKLIYLAFSTNCVCLPSGSTCATGWASSFVPAADGPYGAQYVVATKFTSLVAGAQFGGWRVWTPQDYNYAVGLVLYTGAGASVTGTTVAAGIPSGYHEFPVTPVTLAPGDYLVSLCLQAGYLVAFDATAPPNDSVVTWIGERSIAGCLNFPTSVGANWTGVQPILCANIVTPPAAPVIPSQPADLPVPPAWGCTTIGDVCVRLQQVSEKLDWLIRTEPAVTNSSVAEGTVHAGLTGSGTLSVSGILGVRVLLTFIPTQYGGIGGTPPLHFGLGRIDWQSAEGWLGRRYLGDTPLEQLFSSPAVNAVGYSLSGGVVATVIELVKGP